MNRNNKRSIFKQEVIVELLANALGKISTWVLIISNFSIIIFTIADDIGLLQILWIYWIQSVIIGVFNFIKITSLKEFSTEGFKQGGKRVPETSSAKYSTAFFFLFHYGLFHLVYAVFLSSGLKIFFGSNNTDTGPTYIYYAAIIFLINYIIEFIYYLRERESRPNLGKTMFTPYIRIIPMHLTIILGGFFGMIGTFFSLDTGLSLIVFFTLLKTFIDIVTHNIDLLNSTELKNK